MTPRDGVGAYTNRFPPAPDLIGQYGVDYVVGYWWASSDFERDLEAGAEQSWRLPSHTNGQSIRIYKVARP